MAQYDYQSRRRRAPAPQHSAAVDWAALALLFVFLAALAGVVLYQRGYLNAPAQPDYSPDVRPVVVPPAAPAPAPIPQAPIVVVRPAPADPAPVIPTPAPPPAVEPGQPTAPAQIVIIHRVDGVGGQVITGSGACAAARGARRCGR